MRWMQDMRSEHQLALGSHWHCRTAAQPVNRMHFPMRMRSPAHFPTGLPMDR
jgi:hypothetical protein